MENVLYFASVGLIVLISLYAILKILIKKFNPEESKVNIYGILQGMKNTEIISLSCSIVSYIFLLYIMASFIDLNLYIALISLSLTLISGLLIKNKKVIINLVHTFIRGRLGKNKAFGLVFICNYKWFFHKKSSIVKCLSPIIPHKRIFIT